MGPPPASSASAAISTWRGSRPARGPLPLGTALCSVPFARRVLPQASGHGLPRASKGLQGQGPGYDSRREVASGSACAVPWLCHGCAVHAVTPQGQDGAWSEPRRPAFWEQIRIAGYPLEHRGRGAAEPRGVVVGRGGVGIEITSEFGSWQAPVGLGMECSAVP